MDIQSGKLAMPRRSYRWADLLIRIIREKPLGAVGGIIVLLLLFTGIFADLLAPYAFDDIHLTEKLLAPSEKHFFGTDNLGRDVFSRVIYGARISMYVGLGASALGVVCSTIIGLISGYLGGTFDLLVQRFVDATVVFPIMAVVLTIMSLIGTGLLQVILVLGIWGGILWIRLVRSAVIAIRENVYISAATTIGCTNLRTIFRHILPNIMPIVIVIFSIDMAGNILLEATLSFLGFGVPPPAPSWGSMLNVDGLIYMYEAPWLAIFPGLALSAAVWGINILGDAIRDLLDPRLRGGVGGYSVKKTDKTREKMLKKAVSHNMRREEATDSLAVNPGKMSEKEVEIGV